MTMEQTISDKRIRDAVMDLEARARKDSAFHYMAFTYDETAGKAVLLYGSHHCERMSVAFRQYLMKDNKFRCYLLGMIAKMLAGDEELKSSFIEAVEELQEEKKQRTKTK